MIFSEQELSEMQATQEAYMQDTCLIERLEPTQDPRSGEMLDNTVTSSPLACGLGTLTGDERRDDEMTNVYADVKLRLPIDTEIDETCRVRITHRYGVALAEHDVYDVAETPRRGPSGLVVKLRRVEI